MNLSTLWEAASRSATREFPTFYGTQTFITMSEKSSTDPYPEPNESISYHPILYL
jgi:hypothetical protein